MELLGMRPLVVKDFTPELKLLLTVLFGNTPSNDIDQQLAHLTHMISFFAFQSEKKVKQYSKVELDILRFLL